MAHLPELEVFQKTIYGEARGKEETEEGRRWVAWVIKNRADQSKPFWGGSSIKDVCLHEDQFECWKGKQDIAIEEREAYEAIGRWAKDVYYAPIEEDPTGGCDHFNNPDKEGYPPWTERCDKRRKIGGHWFYRTKPEFR